MKTLAALAAATLALTACGAAEEDTASTSSTTPSSSTSHGQAAKGSTSTPTSKKPSPTSSGTPAQEVEPEPSAPADDAGAGGFDTTTYMSDMWSMSSREETGWMCILFRAEPGEQMGEDEVVDGIVSSVEGLDREEVRDFLDEKCPTAAEMKANSNGG